MTSEKPRGRPRTYLPAEAAQAIYLAGAGESASTIAEIIGDTTADRIRALLASYGVPLLHKGPRQTAMVIVIGDEVASEVARLAAVKGFSPALLVGGMIDAAFAKRRAASQTTEGADVG